jgi:hypothetical protein
VRPRAGLDTMVKRKIPSQITGTRIWENNITTDPTKLDCEDVVWIYLGHDRDQWRGLVNTEFRLAEQLSDSQGLWSM